MNAETQTKATRIEVPLELSPPHFEDEATVATARQVVPIERARTIEFWRKVKTLLPVLLAAMLFGGLGAAAVNYYEHRQTTSAVSPAAPAVSTQPPVNESSPAAVAASTDSSADTGESETVAGKAQGFSAKNEPQTENKRAEETSKQTDDSETASPKIRRANSDDDASKVTRKRRVHPADEAAPSNKPAKSSGAGGIVNVFTGPNPL